MLGSGGVGRVKWGQVDVMVDHTSCSVSLMTHSLSAKGIPREGGERERERERERALHYIHILCNEMYMYERELSSGVVPLLCLVSVTDCSCTCLAVALFQALSSRVTT